LNVKTQHDIKYDFDIYVKETLICFSYLKTILKYFRLLLILNKINIIK